MVNTHEIPEISPPPPTPTPGTPPTTRGKPAPFKLLDVPRQGLQGFVTIPVQSFRRTGVLLLAGRGL